MLTHFMKGNFKKSFLLFSICQKNFINNSINSLNYDKNDLDNLSGDSIKYIEKIYEEWKNDTNSVNSSWDKYFNNLDNFFDNKNTNLTKTSSLIQPQQNKEKSSTHEDSIKVIRLIREFQKNGYLKADLDPLGLDLLDKPNGHYEIFESRSKLDYKSYGFTEEDLNKEFNIFSENTKGIMAEDKILTLKEIITILEKAYCSTIGVDYMHIHSREQMNFLRDKFEIEWVNLNLSKEEKRGIFHRLAKAVIFEEFLHKKFSTHKRYGLEGLEAMISGLKRFVDKSVSQGVKDITLGMAHRGRLNVLANVMKKPMIKIFHEFEGKFDLEKTEHMEIQYIQIGDSTYHLGTFHEQKYKDGKVISMDLLPNPSHLEAVDPVVMGKTRAKQHFNMDTSRKQNIAVLIHGDASFAGQGVLYESMQMENLNNYTIGGTVHVIANNQIGFTTSPKDGRSTPFVTDITKAYDYPIIHVNADDPIAVDFAFSVASEFRLMFNKDVVVDIIGYRRYGHNELDQPMFTQPYMYKAINKKEGVLKLFTERLIRENVMNKEECEGEISKIWEKMENFYMETDSKNDYDKNENSVDINNENNTNNNKREWISKQWEHLEPKKYSQPQITGISQNKIYELNDKINILPSQYNFHENINKIYQNRYNTIKTGHNIDMPTGEALAFASLLDEGYTVRISGEDTERGGFSQRHAVLHDQLEEKKYIPLKSVEKSLNNFQPCNSHLSEFAVLGFELGFSYYNPYSLVMWEAQFGDFANGAQIIIDQFIAPGERKWNFQTGLVLILPHGMDGGGPDHSSCRLERFLQMMDDDINDINHLEENDRVTQIQECNYQVCYPSTSANLFHLLRRQLKRDFRKPLIIAQSKKLYKFKLANSNIEEFIGDTMFIKVREEYDQNIINNRNNVKKILVCSGQIYYDLITQRKNLNIDNIAIIVIEQLGPFPYLEFMDAIKPFPNATITWVQEEHVNQGAWEYVRSRINNLLKITKMGIELNYAGRGPNSAASSAYHTLFEQQHLKLLEDAFKL